MTCDVIVTNTLAESYLLEALSHARSVAQGAAKRKELKYQSFTTTHIFIPLAFETLGPFNLKAFSFLISSAVALQLALAICEKLICCFSAYH
jgi:hypothetical protein